MANTSFHFPPAYVSVLRWSQCWIDHSSNHVKWATPLDVEAREEFEELEAVDAGDPGAAAAADALGKATACDDDEADDNDEADGEDVGEDNGVDESTTEKANWSIEK